MFKINQSWFLSKKGRIPQKGGKMGYLVTIGIITLSVIIPLYFKGQIHEIEQGESYLVYKVLDGDSLTITTPKGLVKIRLLGIDAPELAQDFGALAKRELSNLSHNQYIKLEHPKKDFFGRILSKAQLDCLAFAKQNCAEKNTETKWNIKKDLGLLMIQKGLAWEFQSQGPYKNIYKEAELLAKKEEIGIWSKKNPIPPWEFRKKNKIYD
jgi:micrococcal nuclease